MYRVDMLYRCIDNRNNNIILPIRIIPKKTDTVDSRESINITNHKLYSTNINGTLSYQFSLMYHLFV